MNSNITTLMRRPVRQLEPVSIPVATIPRLGQVSVGGGPFRAAAERNPLLIP